MDFIARESGQPMADHECEEMGRNEMRSGRPDRNHFSEVQKVARLADQIAKH